MYNCSITLLTLLWIFSLQDLMTKTKQRYRWRLLICGIVTIVVLALVIAAAILLTGSPDSAASRTNGAPGISLEEWLSGSLSPKSFNGTWISGKCCTLYSLEARKKCAPPNFYSTGDHWLSTSPLIHYWEMCGIMRGGLNADVRKKSLLLTEAVALFFKWIYFLWK